MSASTIALRPRARPAQVFAKELVELRPDVILAHAPARRVAAGDYDDPDRVPSVADPIGAGFVTSLARPGGNITGFLLYRGERHRQVARDAEGDRADLRAPRS